MDRFPVYKNRPISKIMLLGFLALFFLTLNVAHLYAADVTVESGSKNNSVTLTVRNNHATLPMKCIKVTASAGGLITLTGNTTQETDTIKAGASKDFIFTFDVKCTNTSVTENINFSISTTFGTITPTNATASVEIKPDTTPPTITISGASNGATYFMPVSLTITYSVTDDKDPNPTVNANYPSGTVFDSEGSYAVVVKGKDCAGNEDTKTLSFRIARRPNPDDTYSISDGTPTSITSDPFAKIGVLNRGLIGSLASILNNLKESYAVVNLPVDITSLQKYPLLIIPSDGFNGLETSQSFKDALMQYVQNGGVILSFTQERGFMFDTLPGDWQGTGYLEENGCITYAGGIENQHVFFSGQDSVYIDANVDGYFTAWPKEGKILVRRTKNAMPCLISYPVGQGIVLASTLYSDYGYISGQINLDEKRLIRDIVSWAKDIINPINAYNAGNLVKETVQIQNKSLVDAYSVTYKFYEPDKNLVYTFEEPITNVLVPGQYGQGALTYQLPSTNCPIGIYWIKYILKDALGKPVQEEMPAGRFAVKYNIGTVNISKDINVVVKTAQPFYPIGSTGTFQIVVYNSRTVDVPVRVRYGTSFHVPIYSNTASTYLEQVVPANGSATFNVDVANLARGDYFSAGVFDQSDRTLAFGQEKFYVFYPYVKATVSTDKGKYLPEESGTISYNLSYDFLRFINKTSYEVTANIRLLDQAGIKILEQTKTLLLTGNSFSDQLSFTTPSKGGRYIAQVEILSFGRQVGAASSYIEVLTRDFLTITPHYPVTWMIGGNNTISFDVKNSSLSTLSVGAVKSTLFDPDGIIIRTEEKQFLNLPAGETAAAAFNIPLTQGKFGTYRLKYELLYLGNIYEYYADFLNQAVFNLSFDKLSYKMRENMLLNLDVINNGVFEEDISVRLDIPTFGYTDVKTVHLSKTASAPYTITVPATIASGTHALNVSLNLINQIAKTYNFGVPPSRLTLSIDRTSFNAGDTGTINVANIGGVDTNFQINIKLNDPNGNLVNEINTVSTVQASSSQGISFSIPASAVSGNYLVQTECKNLLKGNEVSTLSELVSVSGITGTVDVRTDKKTYLSSDLKNILTNIVNTSGLEINNATLRLRVYAQTECKQPAAPPAGGGGGGGQEGPYIYPMVPDQFICSDTETYSFNLHPYEHGSGGQQITPKVLLIEDADSWATGYQNEVVLNSLNIPYTRIYSNQLAQTDLYQYTHIIIPSDQPQAMYNNLDLNMNRITGWVQDGGSFQFNGCDVGWAGGHWTYGPGSLAHVYPVYRQQNYIKAPDHPILQGMTNSNFYNWGYVSHGYLTNVPANSQILLSVNSDGSQPTLIDYTLGNGHIVASQNTLEWTNAGRNCPNCNLNILDNIIKYMFQIGFDTLKWSASDVDAGLMSINIETVGDMMRVTPVKGKYGADQVLLTLTDQNGLSATQWVNVAISPYMPTGNLLWEKEIPVSVLNSLDLTTEFDISQYKLTGKFYVEGTLISDIKQEIAKDIDSFYIFDSQLGLEMETDKKIYKPGETVNITARITNNAAVAETGLTLVLAKDGSSIYTVTFDLAAGETKTFTRSISSSASFLLGGKVKDISLVDHVTVESPQVAMTVTGPNVVGFENFDLGVKLENKGRTTAVLTLNFAGEIRSVTLPVGQSASFKRTFAITRTTTYSITLSGDVSQTQSKTVTFGASASIALTPQSVYPEGAVTIPYRITNTGSTNLGFDINFTLKNAATGQNIANITRAAYLLISGSISDYLTFNNLTEGTYTLSYVSPLTSGSVSFRVAKFNRALVEDMKVGNNLTADGKLPITVTVRNTGSNSFAGNLLLDTGFYSETIPLNLTVEQVSSITFNVPLNINAGNYEAVTQALYNRAPISEAKRVLTLMPQFSLVSKPTDPVFMTGDLGNIILAVQNKGLLGGMVEVALRSGDMINLVQVDRLRAGEQKQFTFRFYVFEDLVANWYSATITITNLDTGSVEEIPLAYYVEGYDIKVSAKTDKPCYAEGETARLTLAVNSNNTRGFELDAVASFNDFYETRPFSLGGKPVLENLDTVTSSGDIMLGKTSIFAEADMGKYASNHISLTGGGSASYSYAWCYDQNGDIWTYGWSSGPLSKFNGKTGAWIKNVNIPYYSHLQLAVDKDGRMYGGDYWNSYVAVFNPETGAAIATHYTPNRGYVAGVFWDGEYLWFGERLGSGNRYYRVDVSGGGWNIINTFTSNFNSYGFGMGVVGNMLLISNSTSDSFLYHTNLDFNNNTMSPTYKGTPNQSSDYFTSFNYNGTYLQRKGYYSNTIRNYKAYRKAYVQSGTLTSSVQDVASSENAVLSWDATTPAGTALTVETRTGNTLNPDDTWSAWSAQNNGSAIISPVGRYLQYRVSLSTANDTITPGVHSVTLNIPAEGRQISHTTKEDFEKMPVSIEYSVPINFTGQKLFYGIYTKAGWGIHLNSMHICEATGDIMLYGDKQVYESGETVTIHVYPYKTGVLKVTAPGYQNTFNIQSTTPFDFQFTLSSDMTTGTYSVEGEFMGSTPKYNFDVIGYTVYIQETTLDKTEYYPDERMRIKIDVFSNKNINGVTAVGWIYSGGQYYDSFEANNITLSKDTSSFEFDGNMPSKNGGFAELVIALFKAKDGDPYAVFLTADSKGFDVIADRTPPTSSITIGEPKFESNGNIFVTGSTSFTLAGKDEGVFASGLDKLEYRLNNTSWSLYQSPFTLSGFNDGNVVIDYRAIDKAGNVEDYNTLTTIVDNTPPQTAITASDLLIEGVVNTVSLKTRYSLSATDNLSGVKEISYRIDGGGWQNYLANFSLSGLGAGLHTIAYKAIDNVLNEEAEKSISVRLIVIEVTKTITPDITLLAGVWADSTDIAQKQQDIINLDAILSALGVTYYIVPTMDDFTNALRSGGYNTYLLIDLKEPLIGEEIREAVHHGDGLIFIKTSPQADPFLDDIFGVKFTGKTTSSDLVVNLTESPVSAVGTLQSSGKNVVATINSNTAESYGYVVDKHNTYPSIVYNQYNRGKVLLYNFDLLYIMDEAKVKELIQNSLSLVSPVESYPIALGSMPVRIMLANSIEPVDVKVIETIPSGMTYDTIALQAAETTQNTITWQKYLNAGEKAVFGYYLNLPDMRGDYTTNTELRYDNNGSYRTYGNYSLTINIQNNSLELQQLIIAELRNIITDNIADAEKITNAVNNLSAINTNASNRKEAEQNIRLITKATDEVRKLTFDATEIRLKLDALLKTWEMKWFLL
ncbi:MAG: hypothetical protein WC855_02360 [Thermodesulfovibrionales bacterium]